MNTKPAGITTKIFLDGGDPNETKEIIDLLGFLDGQTTNPSLVAKNPLFQACKESDTPCTNDDLWKAYREIVTEISPLVPESVSIEVYADEGTKAEDMIEKGLELNTWIPNAHIKLPITTEGLKAAEALVGKELRVNMTLCFTQTQAAAVYSATKGAKPGGVYLSPFVGRLDDRGENGMSFIKNVGDMFKDSDHHVSPLVASVRSLDHFMYTLALKADIITAPGKILKEWAAAGMPIPDETFSYGSASLTDLSYQEQDLSADWQSFDLDHELTEKGMARFAADWNNLLG
jgi:transaldolase